MLCRSCEVKLSCAKEQRHSRSITLGKWDVPDLNQLTTASLSQRNRICFVNQRWPHVVLFLLYSLGHIVSIPFSIEPMVLETGPITNGP